MFIANTQCGTDSISTYVVQQGSKLDLGLCYSHISQGLPFMFKKWT